MNRIGLDVHSASFTLAVVNEAGKVTKCLNRPTSAENLIALVGAIPGPKELVVEESTITQWVKDALEPYVDRLIICDPRHNRWIAKDDFADDRTSAIKLAQLLRGGYLKEIAHPDAEGAQLRRSFLHYNDLNEQVVRFKNKLKATYRQAGVAVGGGRIYETDAHGKWLARLEDWPALKRQAGDLFVLIDKVEQMKQECLKAMARAARKDRGYGLLLTMPGAGPVVACGYVALIGTPHRFSRKNKLWRYAAFGNARHVSDEKVYQDRPSKSGSRPLKWVVVQHFMGAVERSKKDNIFKRRYARLMANGLDRKAARRQVCRSLLSVARAIWMKGEPYREAPLS
jgi:transposase